MLRQDFWLFDRFLRLLRLKDPLYAHSLDRMTAATESWFMAWKV